MPTYEYVVTKTLIGSFTVNADSEHDAEKIVRDHAHRIILVNNVSPWTTEIIKHNLVDVTGEDSVQD